MKLKISRPRDWIQRLLPRRSVAGVVGVVVANRRIALVHLLPPGRSTGTAQAAFCVQAAFSDEAQRDALLQGWVSAQGLRLARTVLILEPHGFDLVQMERPKTAPEAEWPALLRWKLKDAVDYPASEAVLDVFQMPEGRHGGQQRSVYVAAAQRERLQQLTAMLQSASLHPRRIDIAPLALRSLFETCTPPAESIGVVQLSPEGSLLYILRGETFFVSRALNLRTQQLAEPDLEQRMQLADQLALDIQRTMDYYDAQFGQSPVRQMYFLGGGAAAVWLIEAVQGLLGVVTPSLDLTPLGCTAEGDLLPLALGGALEGLRA